MKRLLVAAAALTFLAGVALVAFKAYRYRQESQLWYGRWLDLHRNPAGRDHYRAADERVRRAGPGAHRVVFLGASITEQLPLSELFPDQDYVNRGMGGQLIWQQLLRLEPDALDLDPEAVVLKMCAINLLPDAPSLEETQAYYAAMADTVRRRNVKPVLATTVPVTRAWDDDNGGHVTARITAFNAWVRTQAREHQDLVLDYAAALADERGYLRDDLSEDGLHPNRAGRQRMADAIRATLLEGRGQPAAAPPGSAAQAAPDPAVQVAAVTPDGGAPAVVEHAAPEDPK